MNAYMNAYDNTYMNMNVYDNNHLFSNIHWSEFSKSLVLVWKLNYLDMYTNLWIYVCNVEI